MSAPTWLRVKFTPAEFALMDRNLSRVKRFGDFQRFLARILQRTWRDTLETELRPQDIAKVRRYAHYKCGGGYEDSFQAIEAAIDRALSGVVDKN